MFLSARPVRAATRLRQLTELAVVCFYPRGPCGPRRTLRLPTRMAGWFLSARPVRAATVAWTALRSITDVSIRAARAGRDCRSCPRCCWVRRFYPRGPCGPRLSRAALDDRPYRVSIRAARAGRDRMSPAPAAWRLSFLSARPVRAATLAGLHVAQRALVSIRAARAGRDMCPSCMVRSTGLFLSARPVRAATWCSWTSSASPPRFYPRGPCGPRQATGHYPPTPAGVSIRAARAGRDLTSWRRWPPFGVSIRAARAGRDRDRPTSLARFATFLSARPVRAATRLLRDDLDVENLFLSARPVRAATGDLAQGESKGQAFLSARPVRAATFPPARPGSWPRCFYPRGPCGPRRGIVFHQITPISVSIRAARAGRDDTRPGEPAGSRGVSIRAARAGRDQPGIDRLREADGVSIRAARAGRDVDRPVFRWTSTEFLSARPVRAATLDANGLLVGSKVSIRAARAGRDGSSRLEGQPHCRFYPRGPCGPRLRFSAAA